MKKLIPLLLISLIGTAVSAQPQEIKYTVNKIWDNGKHCAFTSLIKYKGLYICSFREGETHIFDSRGNAEGKVRILVSTDGDAWEALDLTGKAGIDLRDPKLSVMPDGRLMVTTGGSIYRNRKLTGIEPQVMFSNDGRNYTAPQPIQLPEEVGSHPWLWRVTWHEGTGYGIVYAKNDTPLSKLYLVKTYDGIHYSLIKTIEMDGFPNESTVRFLPDGRMAIMVRRDAGDCLGYWGTSHAPYTEWEWKKMEFRVGGPDFIVLNDGTVIAGSRNHYIPSSPKTTLYTGNSEGKFKETLVLPSGGDTSYPGIIKVGDELWVSYYSTHETGNASVYLAKIPLALLKH